MDAIESKSSVNELAEEMTAHIVKRLVADEPARLETFQIETDIIENYRRINTYARRIARLTSENQKDVDDEAVPAGEAAG